MSTTRRQPERMQKDPCPSSNPKSPAEPTGPPVVKLSGKKYQKEVCKIFQKSIPSFTNSFKTHFCFLFLGSHLLNALQSFQFLQHYYTVNHLSPIYKSEKIQSCFNRVTKIIDNQPPTNQLSQSNTAANGGMSGCF